MLYAEFDAVLRYAAAPEAATEHSDNQHILNSPVGFELSHGDLTLRSDTPRSVAADFLRDHGRDAEADKLQHHDGPVLLNNGKVKKGRYIAWPALYALSNATDFIRESMSRDWNPPFELNHEGFADEPLPDDHSLLVHHTAPFSEVVHHKDLGHTLADWLHNDLPRRFHADRRPAEPGLRQDQWDDRNEELQRLLKELREAPHAELHPDEQ